MPIASPIDDLAIDDRLSALQNGRVFNCSVVVQNKNANTQQTETMVETETNKPTTGGEEKKQVPFDPSKKHPLKHKWTLWFDSELMKGGAQHYRGQGRTQGTQSWGGSLKSILTVASVRQKKKKRQRKKNTNVFRFLSFV
jgi:hypothetical protein